MSPLLALVLPLALAQEPALIPVADRLPLPAFEALSGSRDGDSLDRQQVGGEVTVINIWYEH